MRTLPGYKDCESCTNSGYDSPDYYCNGGLRCQRGRIDEDPYEAKGTITSLIKMSKKYIVTGDILVDQRDESKTVISMTRIVNAESVAVAEYKFKMTIEDESSYECSYEVLNSVAYVEIE